jgi:curved DNA-binding protein CbpA
MKLFFHQDHYEILEVSRDASRDEIERAYRLARETYASDSLAGYSVFGEADAAALRERMDVAYRVLCDEELRRDYDASFAVGEIPVSSDEDDATTEAEVVVRESFDELDEESADFDGARLRRWRLRRGLELDDVASITKINPVYLRFIEEERFAELPARVYVRGFVSAYAACVGLDGGRVAASYLKGYEERLASARRGRPW